jgi:predicted nucleotidyltransferase
MDLPREPLPQRGDDAVARRETPPMRLTPEAQTIIHAAVAEIFGANAEVWLFGSRVDDAKRGGDIDLLVRSDPAACDEPVRRKLRLLGRLEKALGERKIDVVVESPNDSRTIVHHARETGVRL